MLLESQLCPPSPIQGHVSRCILIFCSPTAITSADARKRIGVSHELQPQIPAYLDTRVSVKAKPVDYRPSSSTSALTNLPVCGRAAQQHR